MNSSSDFNRCVDLETLKAKFLEVYGEGPGDFHVFFAPGRVNLIGEHTDYNGGYVLPVALSIGIYAAVRYSESVNEKSGNVTLRGALGEAETVHLASLNEPGSIAVDLSKRVVCDSSMGWGIYPVGVISKLQQVRASYSKTDYDLRGCQVLYWGNLPVGAGLSSSAALEVLTAYFMLYPTLRDNFHFSDRVWMARLCQLAENDSVGVQCGIMDQFAVAMGKKDHAMLLHCDDLDHLYVPVRLCDYSLVIMDTGVTRRLGDSKYNQRREECQAALAVVRSNPSYAHVESLAQATLDQIENTFDLRNLWDECTDSHLKVKGSVLGRRARHVVTENLRTLLAEQFLSTGDVKGFGRLMIESHISLRDDYEVTGFHLDAMVEAALSQDCCVGARMTGAGFGGCAIALVKSERRDEFVATVGKEYFEKTGLEAKFYVCRIDDGVRCVE